MSDPDNGEQDTYQCDVEWCTMYRVYCAVAVPPSKSPILDEIILSSRRGLLRIEPYTSGPYLPQAALLFMNSLAPGTDIQSGSHVPLMRPFPSYPLAGKSLQEIYDWHCGLNDYCFRLAGGDRRKIFFALNNFAVVDQRTLKDGTILLCSDGTREANDISKKPMPMYGDTKPIPKGLATLRSDGFSSLLNMVPDENGTYTIRSCNAKDSFVFTEQYEAYGHLEYVARIQAKIARGEPLRKIEEETSRLKCPLNRGNTDGDSSID